MRKRIPLPKGRWVEQVLVEHYRVGLATTRTLGDIMAALHGCPPSSTERVLRKLKAVGLVEVRTHLTEPGRSSPRGRKTDVLVLTEEGLKAAVKVAETMPISKRKGPGRYRRTVATNKEEHDLLLAGYLATLCGSLRLSRDERFGWTPGRVGGEAGAARFISGFTQAGLLPDGFVTLRATDHETHHPRRRHVFLEADTGTQHRGVVVGKLKRYLNLIYSMTRSMQDPDPSWGLPLVVFASFDPERSFAVVRWMREALSASHATGADNELLGHGIRLEDFFAATNVRWWSAYGALGAAYASPASRLVRRDPESVARRTGLRPTGGLTSMPAIMHRLDHDHIRGEAEVKAMHHRRLLAEALEDDAVGLPELAVRRAEVLRLNAIMHDLRRFRVA